ncbi:rho GTPase-activating protein 32 [Athalia rosae]|uniref:rho GTPase-activating protein 32 n=1 Tax=Athalia rosae TaxID=37344 RepID=UPI002033C21F|nr:rho GTPase-activating protein 32 [Athalia rosae]XP_048516338.1 rho GTPase-activating protein 32 [Athalia rosae]
MPGPTSERPRAHRLTDIEPQAAKGLGNNKTDDLSTPGSSGANMGSIARFPKLDECAHFHYEHVELGTLEVSVSEDPNDDTYDVRVTSGDACWTLQRSYENFVMFDKQLHRCIFDRKFSSLTELPDDQPENTTGVLKDYLSRFSQLSHEGLNCGPVLNWLQLDNRGRRILVPEADSCPINTPAVAAAYAVRPYTAQAQDEISFQVGDMISVIDMPPPGESTWWRGKHGFAVGFFPAECVAVIGDKVPRHLTVSTTVRSRLPVKPVLRKHGKLIAFFRSFILNRPSRRRLKQSGILKERVFGCDLGEHLLNSGQDVPTVLTCCAKFIETNGLVDGIYRLSGVTSNIQRLRHAFDEDRVPALHSDESILQDIHSVASLLKMYFRELPNPLCTYQLYSAFVGAVQAETDAERLRYMREAVRKLPPPHYRTLEFLMRHLARVAACGKETGMTSRNVAIVWAPNLLRCKELEVGGVAALQGVGVQAVVTEFLVCYAELIFGDGPVGRPKSLAITTPARLLSLEEARSRVLRGESDYIEVGAGPAGLPLHYHTVIELPRKRHGSKRSPSLNWRALFSRGGLGARGKTRQARTPPQVEVPSSLNSLRRLRPVKSADSLDGEDSLGPLLGPPPIRPCGHSRSVSHDSYFDHLADAPSANSPLDLSEIQLNFDLEEREMRMFSEDEGGGIASVEASPRRQRAEGPQCAVITGGSKRKRSRLEERLHCDVELRFIDSQSPDQVMVSADVHGTETPSPLPTPGYLPLLSEASTPLTPATLPRTPPSISPNPANSPRISFRSFTLPLDLGDEQTNQERLKRVTASSDRISNSSHRLSANFNTENDVKLAERIATPLSDQDMTPCERITPTYDRLTESYDSRITASSEGQEISDESCHRVLDSPDQEMTPCDKLTPATSCTSYDGITLPSNEILESSSSCERILPLSPIKTSHDEIPQQSESLAARLGNATREDNNLESPDCLISSELQDNTESEERSDSILQSQNLSQSTSLSSQTEELIAGTLKTLGSEPSKLPLTNTDLDSPMSCEQTLEDLPDSGFVICDSSDRMLTNTENQPHMTSNPNDSGEWVMVERTSESGVSPTSVSGDLTDHLPETVDPALATDAPQVQSLSENNSRTSLDLTMASTIGTDVDTSCMGVSDFTESPVVQIQDSKNSALHANETRESKEMMEHDERLEEKTTFIPNDRSQGSFHSMDANNGLGNNVQYVMHEQTLPSQKDKASGDTENGQITSRHQLNLDLNYGNKRNPQATKPQETHFDDSEACSRDLSFDDHCENKSNTTPNENKNFDQQNDFQFITSQDCEQPQQQSQSSPDRENASYNNKSPEHRKFHSPTSDVRPSYRQTPKAQQNHGAQSTYHSEHRQADDDFSDLTHPNRHPHVNVNKKSHHLQDNFEVVIPSENAAEPCEIAHAPEGASEAPSLDSSCTFSNASSPVDDSVVLRDTASILEELALQRLSGGMHDMPIAPRRRYDSEVTRERRSFDAEIGREIVRERKMRQELDSARGKSEEPPSNGSQHLPPCLRARQARATRAALSRSLDEAKFNRMTGGSSLPPRQSSEDSQHSSTPNVGAQSSMISSNSSDRTSQKNLGGIDLGDPRCRERIERYKEERRTFLRDKYRSESFRGARLRAEDEGEQALLARLKQRASRPSLH